MSFARGTFNTHPYVMGAMYEFLQRLDDPDIRSYYHNLDELWNGRAERLNRVKASRWRQPENGLLGSDSREQPARI